MKKLKVDKRLLIGFIAFSVFQILLTWKSNLAEEVQVHKPDALDTFVPLGFTLVPIKIENQTEMGSLIDNFALVDLHKKDVTEVIESNVRLLRSPRNPDVFAVLVEQERAKDLISKYGAIFTISLKNPDSQTKPVSKKRIIIKE